MLASKHAVVSLRPAMALAPMRRSRAGVKVHSAAAATVLVEQVAVTVDGPVASASKGMTRAEVAALYKKMEAKAKAIIALEEVKAASRPTVRISLRSRVGLGEQWKIVGNCPELGRMHPENAPAMNCTDGELWVLETPIRHGSHTFKAVLRNFEGAYIWEAGNDRKLELPVELGKDDKVNLELSVKMPF